MSGILNINDGGPLIAVWNSIEMGCIFGDSTLHQEQTVAPIHEERHGQAVLDEVDTGIITTLEIPFSRLTLQQWAVLYRNVTSNANSILVKNATGKSNYVDAEELILKPAENGAASVDENKWTHIFKTVPKINMDLIWNGAAAQRVILIQFGVYVVTETGANYGEITRIGPAIP